MSRRIIHNIELEATGDGISRSLQCPGKQIVVVSGKRETGIQKESDNMAKITHDFRASLNIIIGYAELMQDEVPGKINEEQRRSLSDILEYSNRMLDLVNDIDKRL
jgi:signal transduction histidine kinase